MQPSSSPTTHGAEHGHHDHEELGFWRKYIFSTDHKVIGIQYGLCGLFFLLFGFSLMMMMRWQLAYPGQAIPFGIGSLLEKIFGQPATGGVVSSDLYNMFGAMHGTI